MGSMRIPFALALVIVTPVLAFAQSADDVASRVGTVARTMAVDAKEKWSFDNVFGADVKRGNADTTAVRFTSVYLRTAGGWRVGTYGSAAIERSDGVKINERAGLNLAAARKLSETTRLVLLEEIVRAPLDGLRSRNLLGSIVVWTPTKTPRVETSYYGGAGWASERFIDDVPTRDYGAGLAGASATLTLSPTSTLALVQSYTQDLSASDNFKLGTSAALKAAVTTALGLQLSYALAFDHRPVPGVKRTNHAISAGLTLGWKAK